MINNIATVVKHNYKVIKIIEDLENKLSESKDLVDSLQAGLDLCTEDRDYWKSKVSSVSKETIEHLHKTCIKLEEKASVVPKGDAPYEVGDILESSDFGIFGKIISIKDPLFMKVYDLIKKENVYVCIGPEFTHWKKV